MAPNCAHVNTRSPGELKAGKAETVQSQFCVPHRLPGIVPALRCLLGIALSHKLTLQKEKAAAAATGAMCDSIEPARGRGRCHSAESEGEGSSAAGLLRGAARAHEGWR